MKLQFELVFKRGQKEVARVVGTELSGERATSLTIGDVVEKVSETEQFLERLTGLRVHIQVSDQG